MPEHTKGQRQAIGTSQSSRSRFCRILFPILFCLASVAESGAQPPGTQGWVVGLGFGRAAVSFDSRPGDGAGLVSLRIGRRLDRIFTPYLGMAYADIESRGLEAFDTVTFGHVDLGVRLHLDTRRRWVPYGDLALTFWPVNDVVKNGERTPSHFVSGPTLSAGGGLAIHLSASWAIDVNVKAGKGTFRDVPSGGITAGGRSWHAGTVLDLDAASVRLAIGVSWWP